MVKIYFLSLFALALSVFEVGFLAPWLISTKSTELVLVGLVSIAVYLPAMYCIIKVLVKVIKSKLNNEEKVDEGNA